MDVIKKSAAARYQLKFYYKLYSKDALSNHQSWQHIR